jgi:hypothetical protein
VAFSGGWAGVRAATGGHPAAVVVPEQRRSLRDRRGSFFWPQVPSAEDLDRDPKEPCRGAKPRLHSHFFTADGAFCSRDENGEEVDSGRYEVVREDRLVINDVLFNYRIRGDVITLEPVTPECTPCFAHAWGISVASPGGAWERIGA